MFYFDTSTRNIIKYIVFAFLALIAIALLNSCKHYEMEVPVEVPSVHLEQLTTKTDSKVYFNSTDTIIYIINAAGDTSKNSRHSETKYIERVDTIKIERVDSISYPVYLTKKEIKYTTPKWCYICFALAAIVIAILALRVKLCHK